LSPEAYRRTLTSILESAERMSGVVDSLLLLARADSGQTLIRHDPVALGDLALAAVENLEVLARLRSVTLAVDEVEDLVVPGDSLWLNQVLVNLLSNGIKYTEPGGTVTLALRPDGNHAVVEVRDTGIGIPTDHLPHIFDRFYRVDHGRSRAAGGAGLGLSITRWAVAAHGREIPLQSQLANRTFFRLRLPLQA